MRPPAAVVTVRWTIPPRSSRLCWRGKCQSCVQYCEELMIAPRVVGLLLAMVVFVFLMVGALVCLRTRSDDAYKPFNRAGNGALGAALPLQVGQIYDVTQSISNRTGHTVVLTGASFKVPAHVKLLHQGVIVKGDSFINWLGWPPERPWIVVPIRGYRMPVRVGSAPGTKLVFATVADRPGIYTIEHITLRAESGYRQTYRDWSMACVSVSEEACRRAVKART